MFGWVRLSVIGLGVLTVIYVCLSWYSKSVRREKLEQEYDAAGLWARGMRLSRRA